MCYRLSPKLLIGLLVGVVLFGLGLNVLRLREPAYQGIALSTWLEELEGGKEEPNVRAAEAVRQIGTNALMPLLKMLRAKDSKLKLKLNEWAQKQSVFEFHFNFASDYRQRAVAGFAVLGPVAEPAIPSLIELFKDDELAYDAMSVLREIGPTAVPPLVAALANENNVVRAQAATSLADFGFDARHVVPALIRSLKDEDAVVRSRAASSLALVGNPATAVPALIKYLEVETNDARFSTLAALAHLGTNAKPAAPLLVKMMESNRSLRVIVFPALSRIDPETARTFRHQNEFVLTNAPPRVPLNKPPQTN
ncbi:MAG: HEAT repeat domain-containing protein [Verrucomicrobia bacterium]|nr:HEAT repeat domain-containing protein [Verrucomicrobiota bacterium]